MMNRKYVLFLVCGGLMVSSVACADESAPNRRGIERPTLMQGGQTGTDNADKRVREAPQPEVPGTGREFPGQSMLTPDQTMQGGRSVALLADMSNSPPQSQCPAEQCSVKIVKNPCVMQNPCESLDDKVHVLSDTSETVVPGTAYTIDPSWGREEPLKSHPHRPWPDQVVVYPPSSSGTVNHNPYYFNYVHPFGWGVQPEDIQGGTYATAGNDLLGIPWWYAQLVAMPVMMIIDPPLAKRATDYPLVPCSSSPKSIYAGYLPASGGVDPAPVPGKIEYVYPFMQQTTTGDEKSLGGAQQLMTPTEPDHTGTTQSKESDIQE